MPNNKQIEISKLRLDLLNYRTMKQQNEESAAHAMITISPDRFWALMDSILEDGYHTTENIIVQEDSDKKLFVKEGNRRIAALKIIYGMVNYTEIPQYIDDKIRQLNSDWKKENNKVPCVIYRPEEHTEVDKVIALTHARGEQAARDKWTAVARARYDRDKKNIATPGLNLLEDYLQKGRNLTTEQAERWAGDYPLTVLDEAIQKLAPILGYSSAKNMVSSYPKKNKKALDSALLDIGTGHLKFKELRDKNVFFGSRYGIDPPNDNSGQDSTPAPTGSNSKTGQQQTPKPSGNIQQGKTAAVSSNDPVSVKRALVRFKPKGDGRDKIVALIQELKGLDIRKYPHAFCFLLRSIFELSAKAYCNDHRGNDGPSIRKKKGEDKKLAA